MRKLLFISLAVLLVATGIYLGLRFFKQPTVKPTTYETFLSAVRKERREAGDSTVAQGDSDFWYKSSVIYTLDVEVFKDSDGDGTGDFNGLIQKLDYLQSLGVDAIWLAPFQPTPNLDDGYDVSDFYSIDPRLGTMADFQKFMEQARLRNIRVIMDLVVNHTSDQHPWFVQGRTQTSPFHSWYVWSKEKPENTNVGMVFPGVQETIWDFDSVAREYYYHRFYKFQPDLNTQNPAVEDEIRKVIEHWIKLGVTGFRLDAVPFFIEVPQTKGEKFEHQFEILKRMRHIVHANKQDGVILGEANVLPEEQEPFYGKNGEAINMMFNFFVNQHLFYSLATGEIKPLTEALEATKDIPVQSQWAQFLRNHDELDLGRLGDKDREKVYQAFGPDTTMQLYDRGIRRRLSPMLNNNRKKLELAYSMLFALPSTPVIRYGDEIGMGDNLRLKERESVRTPMQWNNQRHGGFSRADSIVRPVIDSGDYSYHQINIEIEQADSNSLLTWTKRMIRLRKACPETGWGNWTILETGSSQVLAIKYEWQGQILVTIHNFSDRLQQAELDPEILA
jgi:maltose alpha-D-glucosyltransferase/alpha-amylase